MKTQVGFGQCSVAALAVGASLITFVGRASAQSTPASANAVASTPTSSAPADQASAPASTPPAAAPSQSSTQLQEVVVTAQKREQNLSTVGISVTALSAENLAQAGITNSVGITFSVPNLENAPVFGPGSDTNFSLRGVAQNDYNDGTESPIATYVDDVYLVPTGAGSFPLYDMQRVEVLRGPQGTLFGRNSTGGLINFISAKPTDQFMASISGEGGSYGTRQVTGILNVPLLPGVLDLRLSGQYHDNDSWMHNFSGTQPDNGQVETGSFRGQLRYKPTNNITDYAKVSYDNANGYTNGIFSQAIGINSVTGNQYLLGPGQNFYGTGAQRNAFGEANVNPGDSDNGQVRRLNGTNSYIAENSLNIDIGRTTITAVSAYNYYQRNQVEDCDGTVLPICNTHYDNINQQFSQEIRSFTNLGRLRLTGGVYFLLDNIKLRDLAPLLLNLPGTAFAERVEAAQTSRSYAIFGNGEYDLSPKFTLIGGLRISEDNKHFQQDLRFVSPADPANPFPNYYNTTPLSVPVGATIAENLFNDTTAGKLTRLDKVNWSGKIELDYKPQAGSLFYGSVSRGVKAPGFNNGIISISLTPEQYQFKTEVLTDYELGYKYEFWDRRAALNLSSFYYNYKNYDTLSFVGVASFIENHNAELYGGEGDFTVRPIDGLTLKLDGGYVHSLLFDVANAGLVSADRQMPLAPAYSVGGSARYEFPIVNAAYILGLQADAHGRASFYNDPGNDSAAKVPAYGIANIRVDATTADHNYTFALSVDNVLDKRYIVSVFLLQGLGGYRYGQIGQPLWFRADFTARFR